MTQPQDGSAYPWTTSGQIFFSCLPVIQNAGGEGFLAITPDGTRYWFDWFAQTSEPTLKKYQYFHDDGSLPKPEPWRFLQRRKNILLATRVQDRFGNTVQYTYANAWNEAPRLTAITASDGRQLTLSYQGSNVSSVSDGTRQWQYQYNSLPSRRGLSAVLLPDGSRWAINFEDFTRAALRYAEVMSPEPGEMFRNCFENEVPTSYPSGTIAGTMVHPSGATGRFTVTSLEHGLSHVPLNCRGIDYTPASATTPMTTSIPMRSPASVSRWPRRPSAARGSLYCVGRMTTPPTSASTDTRGSRPGTWYARMGVLLPVPRPRVPVMIVRNPVSRP